VSRLVIRCPVDRGHKRFITVATVLQEWLVDESGEFLAQTRTLQTSVGPRAENGWTCAECNSAAVVSLESTRSAK
jgi:hypothetical protein